MPVIQKLTTEYIETQDRFRLSGEDDAGEVLTFWLTQRLLNRLVRYLVSALEEFGAAGDAAQVGDERTHALFNEMAQQAAAQQIPEQPPVARADEDQSWLVIEVDVSKSEQAIKLDFKNNRVTPVELLLDQNQLRQWLSILHRLWQQAEWPMVVWPDWIDSNPDSAGTRPPVH